MKTIAIPVNKLNQIEDHFGHCDFYEIYSFIEGGKIVEIKTIKSDLGRGCNSNIGSVLAENGVTIMLAGGIGEEAINVLNACNIQVISGCSGNSQEIVSQFLAGKISESNETYSHHKPNHRCRHKLK
ncbi:MAG: NifB/NifX family molybdenum-iron cluster-binding protein [Lutibacter sp.]|jgi:predicted Fe-Mo cluster-binding NifX family protein